MQLERYYKDADGSLVLITYNEGEYTEETLTERLFFSPVDAVADIESELADRAIAHGESQLLKSE